MDENTNLTDGEKSRIYAALERLAIAMTHDRLRYHEHCLPEYLEKLDNDYVSEASWDVCEKAIDYVIDRIPNVMRDFFKSYDGIEAMGELLWAIENA